MAVRPVCPSRAQPPSTDHRQRKEHSSLPGQKQRGEGVKKAPKGKSSQAMPMSESLQESLETPLLQIEIPDIQQILAYTDPLHNPNSVLSERGPNKPLFTEGYNSSKERRSGAVQILQDTFVSEEYQHRGDQARPIFKNSSAPKVLHTTLEKDTSATDVTPSGSILSTKDPKEKKTMCTEHRDILAHAMQPGEKVAGLGQSSRKRTYSSGAHEMSHLDANDIAKKNSEVLGVLKATDVPLPCVSEDPKMKKSNEPKVDKESFKKAKLMATSCDQVPTNQLENRVCAIKPAENTDSKNISGTGASLTDSRPKVSSTTKRKKSDSNRQLAKKTKSQSVVSSMEESIPTNQSTTVGHEMNSTSVLLLNKPKVDEKPQKDRSKRKKTYKEKEQEPLKLHRSHLSLHMFESVQVFHRLGKKGESTGLSHAPGSVTVPISTEDNPDSTGNLTAKVQEKPLLGIQRGTMIPEKPKSLVDNPLTPLSTSNNTRPGVRIPPGKEMRKETENILPVTNMLDSKVLGEKQILSKERSRSSPGQGTPYLKDPWTRAEKVPAPASHHPPASLKGPMQSALNQQLAARPPGCSDPAAAFPGPGHVPGRLALALMPALPRPTEELEISIPISKAQRPEREAMKRRARWERERACRYTSMGKLQFFVQREKDQLIAKSCGYRRYLLHISKNYLEPD
ncbi:uncharacterized protein C2orf78 homolog [Ambystoma mexicanum]|uniref:uncharacterized protein C2orf78 homolog n=1 Tax=Ambystoma mexicanum TaxID=8296 RepID=UPI0037E8E1C4